MADEIDRHPLDAIACKIETLRREKGVGMGVAWPNVVAICCNSLIIK